MNWDRIEGNWKQLKGKIKEQWGKLTDDEIDTIAGKRDQLAGKLQNSYGITKDEAEDQIESFADRYGDHDDATTRSSVGPSTLAPFTNVPAVPGIGCTAHRPSWTNSTQ